MGFQGTRLTGRREGPILPDMLPHLLAALGAYALGCLSPGHLLARARGLDLRKAGSGSTGARNAGRLLGRKAFVLVFLLDGAKGALAVGLAWAFGPPGADALALVAVVAGHVWPAPLGFRGGRGVSPAVGGLLVLSWKLTGLLALPLLLGWALARSFKRGGLLAAVAAPPLAFALRRPLGLGLAEVAACLAVALLLAFTHLRRAKDAPKA